MRKIRVTISISISDYDKYAANGSADAAVTVPRIILTEPAKVPLDSILEDLVDSLVSEAYEALKKKELELEEEKEADENLPKDELVHETGHLEE